MATLKDAEKYVKCLVEDGYESRPAYTLADGMGIGEVARVALTPAALARWVADQKALIRGLRQVYGEEPVDARDAGYDNLLK